jgi:neutral ceramidase
MFSFSWRAIVAALTLAAPLSAAEPLRAGAAKADVTPPTGFPMWGYGARKDAPCDGVLDPLLARAVVLAVGDEKLAIVSLDLGRAPTRAVTAAIRERLRGAGITHLFLGASHTHHGPVLELDTWPDAKNPYVRQLERKLGDLILEAAANLRPARLGVASRQVALNRNRQSKRPDAPVDRELLVVRVEGEDGKPVAHLVNFAAHATMTDSHVNKFSADYPGAMAALVEKETAAPCLFLQGAAGDLSANPPAGVSGPQAFGAALGREVLGLIPTMRWGAPEWPALSGCNETFRFRARLDISNPLVRAGLGRAFFPELIAAYEREYAEGVRPELEVALLNGDLGIVGVSGEFFCGHALSLKRRARLGHLLFVGYCNDYQQYFPTLEAAAEGGYGTLPPVAMAELGAGERVTDRALYHLYRLRGKLSE